MGKNIVERAVSPYNAANRAIQHETYGLFAPAANVNKPGMAGFDPRYFAVREQIVELSQAFLKTIQPIIREVPGQGIDNILEPNCLYINVSARVVDTVSANGELEYIEVTGSLMVFGTETAQTHVLFAEGRIWIREVTLIDDELLIDEFMPIGSDGIANERLAEMENEIAGCVSLIEDITNILVSMPTIIREVPEQGINGMLERNSLYVDAFARVKTSTYDSHGNHSPVITDMLGSLMVFGTESIQTQVFFANGCIWTRKITRQGDEVAVGTFELIASKDKVELLTARVANLNTTVYDEPHYIPEVYDTTDQMPDGYGSWHGYYLTFGKDYLCRIPEGEPTPTEFKMLVEVHTGSGPEWFTIIDDPDNTNGDRFCSFRIESFENSVAKYWYNGKQYEAIYDYESGISSTTATLYCNYEVFTEEDGLPTFEYVYPLRNRIKALEKRMPDVEGNIRDIKVDINFMKNDITRVSNEVERVSYDVEQLYDNVDDLTARVSQIAGKQFEVKIVNGIDEVTEEGYLYMIPVSGDNQSEVDHYVEYLFTNGKPEYIGTTQVDLTDYLKKSEVTPLYEHNILINFRTANEKIASANSDGSFLATLTLINQDPIEYTFSHHQDYTNNNPKVMPLQEAWQLLRLYRAIQLSTDKDLNLQRACSGALVKPETASPYTAHYCINNSVSTKYYDFTDTDWKRLLVVHATRVGSGNVGTYTTEISVGHPTFISGKETSLWTTRDEFAAGEYNLIDSFGKSYSTYFVQQRIYCQDTVRILQ